MRVLALALALAASPFAGAQSVRDALAVGDLVCEFSGEHGRSLIEDLVDAPRPAGLLLVYASVTPGAAQVISSEAPGRRDVRVRATDRAVHFIERVGPSVRVTTLTSCQRQALRRGTMTCVRFAAHHAWHFDERTEADPDRVYAELPSGASRGRCEAWKGD